jgi:hypothetical protein
MLIIFCPDIVVFFACMTISITDTEANKRIDKNNDREKNMIELFWGTHR